LQKQGRVQVCKVPIESRPRRLSNLLDPVIEPNHYEGEAKSIWYLANCFERSLALEAILTANKNKGTGARPIEEMPFNIGWPACRRHPKATPIAFTTIEVAV